MLYEQYAIPCTRLIPTQEKDDEGGFRTTWQDSTTFTAYKAFDSSMEARKAEKEGVTSLFDILVAQDVEITYDDYFRDNSTGLTYRITSVPNDKATPPSASFSLKYFNCERRETPT